MSDKEEEEELKPDAISTNGVLEFLKAPPSPQHRPRAFSSGTQDLVDAQKRQLKFQRQANALNTQLERATKMLQCAADATANSGISGVVVPQSLSVLGGQLKVGAATASTSASEYPPSLFAKRLEQVIAHARKLQARIADTASRVLVTGDLNAGKTTLCNALLRRHVLPVDQQPCTDVFCEVIDAHKNGDVEEVHAVPLTRDYVWQDATSYKNFGLDQLPSLVHRSSEFKLLVVYIRDSRPPSQSLLANGTVDVCLIDAPGLNVSAVTTTELFGRQEEIDLVIFVVSAANHFTQSAREFVTDAASEKSLLFIAVQNFDKIRDQERCRQRVLDQVGELAPQTRKGAQDFVHFLGIPDEDPAGDSPDDPPNGAPNADGLNAIDHLESSLRNFILNKRSDTKLAPARTFLLNVLADLRLLAVENRTRAEYEQTALQKQIDDLVPEIDNAVREYADISDGIDRDTERLTRHVLTQSEEYLALAVSRIGEDTGVEWPGLPGVFEYITETRDVLVSRVLTAVAKCEDEARELTASAVDSIKQLGVTGPKVFNKMAMFSRRRDDLRRHIRADFGLFDLFDVSALLETPLPVLSTSKRALVTAASAHATWSSALGGATAFSAYQYLLASPNRSVQMMHQALGVVGNRSVWVPLVALSMVALGAYVVYELPRTIPRRLARKIAFEIDELGYVRANAERISAECRKVLRLPALDVRAAFQTKLDSRTRQRQEFEAGLHEAADVAKVFGSLEKDAETARVEVQAVDL